LRIIRIEQDQPEPVRIRPVKKQEEEKPFLTAQEAGMPAVPKLKAGRIKIRPEPPAA